MSDFGNERRGRRHGGASVAYYLGNGQGFSVQEVIALAHTITGREIPIVLGPRRPGDPPRLVADASHARQVLGWAPRHASLEGILETAWRWHQEDERVQAPSTRPSAMPKSIFSTHNDHPCQPTG